MRRRMFDGIVSPPARLIDAVRFQRPTIDVPDVPERLVALARSCLQKDWKLRLELVRWEHFAEPAAPSHHTDAKDRVRRRLSLADRASARVRSVPANSRRRLLANIGGSLASVLREICLQAGTFPPIEVRRSGAADEQYISVTTGPSEHHFLRSTLVVVFGYELMDAEGLFIRVRSCAALGRPPEKIPDEEWRPVYSGEPFSAALRERLDVTLHLALETALDVDAGEPYVFLRPNT